MPGLRSLSNRLALIFALIVAGALGTIYLFVTPRLEQSLRSQKLAGLVEETNRYAGDIERLAMTFPSRVELNRRIRVFGARSSAEVLLLANSPPGLFGVADSTPDGGVTADDVQAIAQQAAVTRKVAKGTQPTRNGRQAIAARPIVLDKRVRYVLVFADSLSDVQANVALIRRQVLASGALALVIAVLAGYLVARALAARVKRLEEAARKVAGGDFSNPIRADSDDELGQLAAAFDDMQHQLARLDTARKQFIASASHELRTPIFSLGGFIELLEDEDLDEPTRGQFLAQVRGQVERLRKLATELLDLSRLEAGGLELRPEPTDLGALARQVAGEFAPRLAQRGAALELRTGSEPIELECDPERVAQVMRILL